MASNSKVYDANGNYIPERDRGEGDWQRIAYEDLCNAIVEMACKDYVSFKSGGSSGRARENLTEVMNFFNSQWYERLTKIDKTYLLKKLDELVEIEKKKLHAKIPLLEEDDIEDAEDTENIEESIDITQRKEEVLKEYGEKVRSLWEMDN